MLFFLSHLTHLNAEFNNVIVCMYVCMYSMLTLLISLVESSRLLKLLGQLKAEYAEGVCCDVILLSSYHTAF